MREESAIVRIRKMVIMIITIIMVIESLGRIVLGIGVITMLLIIMIIIIFGYINANDNCNDDSSACNSIISLINSNSIVGKREVTLM